ncbi:MAG: hypothetical protein EON96_11720 [Caulobacteraceae bacterium]|nr:MAG: hypothetical protein EON96_11720 [Caulobacteraceae bacterium]
MRTLFLVAALMAAVPAVAETPAPTRAVLVDAAKAPAGRLVLDGAIWRCDGATCVATGGSSQPASRACRRVVSRLGAVTEFAWKGEALSAEQLAICNA